MEKREKELHEKYDIPVTELNSGDVIREIFRQNKQISRMEATLINIEKMMKEERGTKGSN